MEAAPIPTSTKTKEDALSPGQLEFLDLAARKGISRDLFGRFVPQIQFKNEPFDSRNPTICYIHTGGTLMMVPDKTHTDKLTFEGAIDIAETINICDRVSNIKSRYNIIAIYLANQDSKEVNTEMWTALAATVYSIYDQVEGVVVGHGTHTLEYSTAALSFSLRNIAIPVVFTASQIPIVGRPGSDGLGNLTGAMEIAAYGNLAEVVAYANGQIFRGSRVTKKNDNRLDVFESRILGPIGFFTASGVELLANAYQREKRRKFELFFSPKFSKSVSILKIQPGMDRAVIDYLIERGKDRGIILETYGSGAIPREYVETISKHVKAGHPIFLSSSCAESGVHSSMQLHDVDAVVAYEAGVRNLCDMSTSAATVKLMNILGNHPNASLQEIQEEMVTKCYAGEITLAL